MTDISNRTTADQHHEQQKTDQRQPPQDYLAEQSVLGGMLLSKDAVADVIEKIRPDDFYRPAHQTIYDAILALYGRGEPADAITVAAELERRGLLARVGNATYLHTLIACVPTAANAGYYASIVAEKATLRRLVEAGTRVVQFGYAGADGADVDEIVDRAQAEIYEVTQRRTSEDMVALEDLLQPTMDEIDAIGAGGSASKGVPTGFPELDDLTNGLHPGQLVLVAARPGVGKALALDTPLPTPQGWTTMGQVRPGELLLDHHGRPTAVVATTDVMTNRPCFELTFSDGTQIVADAEHQWPTAAGILTSAQLCAAMSVAGGAGAVVMKESANMARRRRAGDCRRRTRVRVRSQVPLGPEFTADPVVQQGPKPPAHFRHVTVDVRSSQNGWRITGTRRHTLVSIRAVDSVPVRCVQVANAEHLYLAGQGQVPTHNSTLAMDFLRACSIKHGQAAVMFSLEMSKSEIVMRLLSAEASVKLQAIRSGHLSDDDWVKIGNCMSRVSDAPLFIDDSPNLTMMEIRAKARRLSQRCDLRLIVVDYLQLMTSGQRFESRQQEVSYFSRSLKLMAKELEVPVVAISQLNRGPEQRTDKRPQVSDLRESGSLEQDCDAVILLYRPDAIDRDDPRGGEADLILGKHRNGPTATITVCHQLHLSRFSPMGHMAP